MKLIYCGTGAFGIPALRALVAAGFPPTLVVSQPDRPQGRHGTPAPPPFAAAARELGCPLYQPERINRPEALERLRAEHCDIMIVAAYGQILKRAVLDLPRHGCVNIHGSLLPRHRGASPVQGAILAGDSMSGTTLMLMDEGLDTGPVLAAQATAIGAHETAGALHDRLAALGGVMLLPVLHALQSGAVTPQPQDSVQATHCGLIDKSEGLLRWELSATELDRRIRAFTPWPGAWTFVPGSTQPLRLSVLRAQVVAADPAEFPASAPTSATDGVQRHSAQPGTVLRAADDSIVVACGVGALLLQEVQPAGKKPMSVAAWLRGYALPAGAILGVS